MNSQTLPVGVEMCMTEKKFQGLQAGGDCSCAGENQGCSGRGGEGGPSRASTTGPDCSSSLQPQLGQRLHWTLYTPANPLCKWICLPISCLLTKSQTSSSPTMEHKLSLEGTRRGGRWARMCVYVELFNSTFHKNVAP